jgi:hypothetical protein
MRLVDGGIFAAFAGVGARADRVHGGGDRLVRLGAERAEGHGAGDEALVHVRRGFDVFEGQWRAGRANLKQIAQDGGLFFDGLRGKCGPGDSRLGDGGYAAGTANDGLESLYGLWLPGMRLGLVCLAEADPSVVGKIFGDSHDGRGRSVFGWLGRRILAVRPDLTDVGFELGEADAAEWGGRSEKAAVDDVRAEPERVEEVRAAVAIDDGDAHLGHDLGEPEIEGVQEIGFALFRIEAAGGFEREPGTDGSGAHA